ncbi:hypothetical protein SS12_01100 [Enterobacter hormaechei subsp. hoffmannii]|nr:hypothetical protein SS12_01100 [Enterobacter hormaechei subsp. hoffmannii]
MLLYPFHMPDQGMEFARQRKNFLSLNDIVIACNSLWQYLKTFQKQAVRHRGCFCSKAQIVFCYVITIHEGQK